MIRAQPEFVTGYPLQFAGGKNSISKIERNYADFTFAFGKRKAQLFVFEAAYTACNFRFYPAQVIFPLFTCFPLIALTYPHSAAVKLCAGGARKRLYECARAHGKSGAGYIPAVYVLSTDSAFPARIPPP